jgi:hypothetical protein
MSLLQPSPAVSAINTRRADGGWGLLEALLGLALMALVLGGTLALQTRLADRRQGVQDADAVSSFTQLAAQYFVAHRAVLEAIMAGSSVDSDHRCQINVPPSSGLGQTSVDTAKHTCAIDSTLLWAQGLWPSGVPVDNGAVRWVAVFRQVYSNGQASGADEVLVLSAALQNGQIMGQGQVVCGGNEQSFLERMQTSMALLGGAAGFVPPGHDVGFCQYNATLKQVCGRDWVVTLSDFL